MKYYVESELRYFDFWSGAEQIANAINARDDSTEIWEYLEQYLEYCEDLSDTEVNDFVWFDAEEILRDELDIELF